MAWNPFKLFRRRDWKTVNTRRIARLRDRGARIGEGCVIFTDEFSTEPCLIELGDRVAVSGGTTFLTHNGSVRMVRRERPRVQNFGRIVVGSGTFIGEKCILLPGTFIGANCLIGAGSVVRGKIPDNSLVFGNPARVVGRASLALERMLASPDSLDTLELTDAERRKILEQHFGLGGAPQNK